MSRDSKHIALIGYSGHAYVVFEVFFSQGQMVSAYTEKEEKQENPFMLTYLGDESDEQVRKNLQNHDYFVCLGENHLRRKVSLLLRKEVGEPLNALHKTSIVSRSMDCGTGILFAPRSVVNAKTKLGDGVICNTGCIIEHECVVGDYAHIAPGAILCGNVSVGENTLVGAGSVVLPGVKIGKDCVVGAGSVVVRDIRDGSKVYGNPAR